VAAEEFRVNYSLARIEGQAKLQSGFCKPLTDQGIATMVDSGQYQDIIRLTMSGGPGFEEAVGDALRAYARSLHLMRGKEMKLMSPAKTALIERRIDVATKLQDIINGLSITARRIMIGTNMDLCSCGCEDYRIEDLDDEIFDDDWTLPSWSRTEELAAFLEVNLEEYQKQLTDDSELDDLDTILNDPWDGEEGNPIPSRDSDGGIRIDKPGGHAPGEVVWGIPGKITEAAMPQRIPNWKVQRSNRAVSEGTLPRFMHRWPVDQRVFVHSRRTAGGTILIDDSSSMGLSSESLDRMIEVAPAATIAVYAGNDGGNGGEIRVVARNGKRAAARDLDIREFGGNGIDGPALEWLGDQPYPRVWITDGGVTAMGAHSYVQIRAAAKDLCKKHRVSVVETAEEATEMLKTGQMFR
jgi:hypothetical protein